MNISEINRVIALKLQATTGRLNVAKSRFEAIEEKKKELEEEARLALITMREHAAEPTVLSGDGINEYRATVRQLESAAGQARVRFQEAISQRHELDLELAQLQAELRQYVKKEGALELLRGSEDESVS